MVAPLVGASLADLWPALQTVIAEWLLEPGDGAPDPRALLDERLRGAADDEACGTLHGVRTRPARSRT
jgi:hypothetical protein